MQSVKTMSRTAAILALTALLCAPIAVAGEQAAPPVPAQMTAVDSPAPTLTPDEFNDLAQRDRAAADTFQDYRGGQDDGHGYLATVAWAGAILGGTALVLALIAL